VVFSRFYPGRVGRTYNAGLCFALLIFLFLFFWLGSQTLLKILHYCPILPCTFARQPCFKEKSGFFPFLPALVRTYNAGLSFALLILFLFFWLGSQTLLKILHYCPILPCTFARQPCLVALPGSLARQPCLVAFPGSLARQPCPAVGRHAALHTFFRPKA
jgi:hypothetical protein